MPLLDLCKKNKLKKILLLNSFSWKYKNKLGKLGIKSMFNRKSKIGTYLVISFQKKWKWAVPIFFMLKTSDASWYISQIFLQEYA